MEPTKQQLANRELAAKGGTQSLQSGVDPNLLLSTVQDYLLKTSDMVSSGKTGIQEAIDKAISGQEKAGAASTARIESQFGREIGFQKEQFGQQRTGALESQRGFATNNAALQALDTRTEKSLRDLEQRKQELILAGESETAGKISEMQFKALEFKQQAEQQAFSNIFNLGQFALNVQAQERATSQFTQTLDFQKSQQEFTKTAAMAELATKYGEPMLPGDTLESIAKRVAPKASAEHKARIAQLLKDTKKTDSAIMATSALWEQIKSGKSASAAAFQIAANVQGTTGEKVSTEQLNLIIKEAEQIETDWKKEQALVKSEEEGKGFWNTFSGMFGQPKALEAKSVLEQSYYDEAAKEKLTKQQKQVKASSILAPNIFGEMGLTNQDLSKLTVSGQ